MLDPHPDRLDGIKYCRFYLGGYVAYIKTDARPPTKTWANFTMKPGQPLCILARDMRRSKELARMLHKQCDLNRLAWCGIEIATIQNDERSLPYPLSRRAAAG